MVCVDERAKRAKLLFLNGYNCSQAVFAVFAEDAGLDPATARMVSSPFGGGMGRLREVCGTLSGVFMATGLKFGGYDIGDYESKKRHYAVIQELASRFREENGSIICRELLGLDVKHDAPAPERRTAEYYKKRPCPDLVEYAVGMYDRFLEEYENGKIKL